MIKQLLILVACLLILDNAYPQLNSSITVKQIDQINNNTALDIFLNPTSKVTVNGLTEGELLYYNSGISSLENGNEGQLLSITGGVLDFIDPPASSPLTTKGDLYTYDTDNQRLSVGTDNQLLSVNSSTATGLEWIDPPVTSPTTTQGDLIYRGASEDVRLAIGTNDQLLTVSGGVPSWQDAPVSTTLTTKGDIQTFDTANARLPVGNDGEFLVADSAEVTGLKYTNTLQGKLNPISNWQAYTPTNTQGFGTISSVELEYRRVGSNLEVRGYYTTGTVTAVEGQIGLPSGLLIDQGTLTSVSGTYTRDTASASNGGLILTTGGDDFVNFTAVSVFNSVSTNALAPANASNAVGTGQRMSLEFSVPIAGWDSGIDAVVQNMELTAETANELNAVVNTSGAIDSEDYDFLNGNCTNPSTGRYVCTFNSGIFTVIPEIVVTPYNPTAPTQARSIILYNVTTSGFSVQIQQSSSNTLINQKFNVSVSKQGADVNKTQTIVATLTQDSLQDKYSETEITYGFWNGEQLYRRCFTVSSDITSTSLDVVTWASGLKPKGIGGQDATTYWNIEQVTSSSGNQLAVLYNDSDGTVDVFIVGSYRVRAGSSYCMDYTK